jgi:probable addiction module antidote protein
MKNTRPYDDYLQEKLKNPEEAIAYLNVHLEDNEPDSEQLFLMALRDVARAYGVAEIAEKSELGRESLYKALSENGNPKLTTLRSLLKAMNLKLSVSTLQNANKKTGKKNTKNKAA